MFDPRIFYLEGAVWTRNLIVIIGTIDLAFSSLVVFFFLVKRAPLKFHDIWFDFFDLKVGIVKKAMHFIKRLVTSIFILL